MMFSITIMVYAILHIGLSNRLNSNASSNLISSSPYINVIHAMFTIV